MKTGNGQPTMPYWHVYVDADGTSRQERFALSAFQLKGINPKVAPQWNDKMEPSQAGGDLHGLAGGLGRRMAREP